MQIKTVQKLTVLMLLLSGISGVSAPEKDAPKPTVFVETSKAEAIFDLLTYPARIVPKVNATLLSEVDGIVLKISAPLGTPVKTDERVILIKHTDPVYEYADVTVSAPVDGIVGQVEVTEGSRVNKGQKLATIVNPGKILIQIEVAGSDLPAIKSGLRGELKIPGAEKTVSARVTGVSPFVDPGTGTATAELALVNPKDGIAIPPGLVGRVSFRVRDHQGIQLPESAVVYKGNDTLVRLVEGGKAKTVPVKLGNSRRGFVEILSGIASGNSVVVRTSSYIANGEEVNVQKAQN